MRFLLLHVPSAPACAHSDVSLIEQRQTHKLSRLQLASKKKPQNLSTDDYKTQNETELTFTMTSAVV